MKRLGLGRGQTAETMEVVVRMVVICGLVVWACFIIAPFIKPILWGAILASALYPVFIKVCDRTGGRRKLVGIGFILISILVMIVPAVILVGGSVEGVQKLVVEWRAGELKVPLPHERIKEWPMIGIPLTALWAFLVLILAVIQLSPAIILLPIAIYVFSTHGGMPAVLFAILCVVVSTIDNFIKPVLMGRNTDTPMVVIMVGALGGLVLSGVMGLFLGAVVVALCYQLFLAWLYEGPGMEADPTDP